MAEAEREKIVAFLLNQANAMAKLAEDEDDRYAADAAVTLRRVARNIADGRHHDQA